MDDREVVETCINLGKTMQIATVNKENKPWICTVYYVSDKALNVYWLSLPTRRHSAEIMDDKHAAIAIAIKTDMPVIGIQAEGTVEVVNHAPAIKGIMEKYIEKYDSGLDYYDNFVRGREQHRMYKFTPKKIQLFDEVHFPNGSPRSIEL